MIIISFELFANFRQKFYLAVKDGSKMYLRKGKFHKQYNSYALAKLIFIVG